MKYETVKDATYAMVAELNAFPQDMLKKLMKMEPDDWMGVTPPAVGGRAYVFDLHEGGEIKGITEDGEYVIELDVGGETAPLSIDDFVPTVDDYLPMWGTMWQFNDPTDTWWLEEKGGLQLMADCGFRIFESEQYGYFFGIDGRGYDFYEAHWIPLYKARGLRWSKEEDEATGEN